jgi:hypothetical protein
MALISKQILARTLSDLRSHLCIYSLFLAHLASILDVAVLVLAVDNQHIPPLACAEIRKQDFNVSLSVKGYAMYFTSQKNLLSSYNFFLLVGNPNT